MHDLSGSHTRPAAHGRADERPTFQKSCDQFRDALARGLGILELYAYVQPVLASCLSLKSPQTLDVQDNIRAQGR